MPQSELKLSSAAMWQIKLFAILGPEELKRMLQSAS